MAASNLPEKPTALPPLWDNMPLELREIPQWCMWRYVWVEDKQKWDKPPFQPNGNLASSTDPKTWRSFDAVKRAYRTKQFDGVGFFFHGDYTGIDMDDHIDADLVARVDSYAEESISGTGAHIITRGAVSTDGNGARKGNKEIYFDARYFIMTGRTLSNPPKPIVTTNGPVHELYDLLSAPTEHVSTIPANAAQPAMPTDEQAQRFAIAMKHVNERIGKNNGFAKVWNGQADYKSNSEALHGLLMDLTDLTLLDDALTKLLAKQSPVYLRNPEKYDRTIENYDSQSARKALLAITPKQHAKLALPVLTELEANALPLPEWVLPGIVVKGQITVLSGKKGSFKTFEAIHQTMKIAQQMNTLYIAAEDPIGVGIRRQAWRKYYQCATGVMLTIPQAVKFHDPQEVQALIEICDYYSIRHITIDTMAACTRGLNENAADDMGKVLEGLERVREMTYANILALAHESSKNANGIRGWSGIGDASYVELSCKRMEKSKTVTLKAIRVKMALEQDFTHTLIEVDNTLVVTEIKLPFVFPQKERIKLYAQSCQLLRIIAAAGDQGVSAKKVREAFANPNASSIKVDLSRLKNVHSFIAQEGQGKPYTITETGLDWLQDEDEIDEQDAENDDN